MKILKLIIILLFSTLFICSNSFCWAQQKNNFQDIDLGQLIKTRINLHSQILGFELGKTKLSEIEKALGKGTLITIGKNHHRYQQVCYKSTEPDDETILIFYNGKVGGETIREFSLHETSSNLDIKGNCRPTLKVHRRLKTTSGLALNLGLKELQSIAGLHNRHIKITPDTNTVQFRSYYDLRMNEKEIEMRGMQEHPYWTIIFTLTTQIKNDKIISFAIKKYQST